MFSGINYRPKEGVTNWIVLDTGIRKPLSTYSPSGHEDSETAKHLLSNCPGGQPDLAWHEVPGQSHLKSPVP